ncbi:hypothetical protein FM103_01100 [Corynebacterium xerosis]|nr:hypothetical protein FM103_01100 [Corynebacterium xerosis]
MPSRPRTCQEFVRTRCPAHHACWAARQRTLQRPWGSGAGDRCASLPPSQ